MVNIHQLIEDFMNTETPVKGVYNEISLQLELGIYLREHLPKDSYWVQFERNITSYTESNTDAFVKKEMDIVVEDTKAKEKYAIELKFPVNGQYPEQMKAFLKDIRFMEQVLGVDGFVGASVLTLVEDKLFYTPAKVTGFPYDVFRTEANPQREIRVPKDCYIGIENTYKGVWKPITDSKGQINRMYYHIPINGNKNNF